MRRAVIQSNHYAMYSPELGSARLYINMYINQIQTQCLGMVPAFHVNKFPVMVVFNSMIPLHRSLKILGY